MNILLRKREFVRLILSRTPAKLSHLISFGCQTLLAQSITSSRANARRTSYCWATAKSKMGRLLGNRVLTEVFATIIVDMTVVEARDVVCVDFSDFGDGRQVLLFAKQTKDGRALPLYFEILEYPINKGSQNLFVATVIKRFYVHVGCHPTLVFDRGFAAPYIVQFLAQHKHRFVVRIKAGKKLVTERGVVQPAHVFRRTDTTVCLWVRVASRHLRRSGERQRALVSVDE